MKPIQPLEIFLMNDQPFNCPHCGARCETLLPVIASLAGNERRALWRSNLTSPTTLNTKRSIQQCLNPNCGFTCYEEEDDYYIKLWE